MTASSRVNPGMPKRFTCTWPISTLRPKLRSMARATSGRRKSSGRNSAARANTAASPAASRNLRIIPYSTSRTTDFACARSQRGLDQLAVGGGVVDIGEDAGIVNVHIKSVGHMAMDDVASLRGGRQCEDLARDRRRGENGVAALLPWPLVVSLVVSGDDEESCGIAPRKGRGQALHGFLGDRGAIDRNEQKTFEIAGCGRKRSLERTQLAAPG